MQFLEKLVYYLDDSIKLPIIKKRIGLDPIIGLIPWLGDAIGLVLSTIPIAYAIKEGVSLRVVLRMILYSFIDFSVGGIPILGDLFDFFFKSNRKNLNLLESYRKNPSKIKTRTTWAFVLIALALFSILIGLCLLIWLLFSSIFNLLLSNF